MPEHMNEWLDAYMDGELHGRQLLQVEEHIRLCRACRAELEQMQALSALLHQAPVPAELLSPDRLAELVNARIPSQSAPTAPRSFRELLWWAIPLLLVSAWVFLQATYVLSNWIWLGGQLGLFGAGFSTLFSGPVGPNWLPAALERLNIFPSEISLAGSIGASLWAQFSRQSMVFILFLSWLILWQVRHKRQTTLIVN